VANRTSSWDKQWTRSYGGFDDPNSAHRSNYIPVKFTPRQNPFYCALPYTIRHALAIGPKRRALCRGSRRHIRAPPFPPAKIDGWRSVETSNNLTNFPRAHARARKCYC
jgi:hypothetical protein